MRKPTFWFPTCSDTNQAVQLQKMARGLKFRIYKVEGLYYPCSENKGADQLRVTAKLICVFVFAYAKCCFSHDVAQIQKVSRLLLLIYVWLSVLAQNVKQFLKISLLNIDEA